MIYETDTDATKVWDGSAWVGSTNAASLNGVGQSVAYTPTWTNLTVGNGVQDFIYVLINKFVYVEGTLTLGTTSSVGTSPQMSLPITAAKPTLARGVSIARDVGVAFYPLFASLASTTETRFYTMNAAGTNVVSGVITATNPFTWITGDVFHIAIYYEAA
jgi:hypothetical protein